MCSTLCLGMDYTNLRKIVFPRLMNLYQNFLLVLVIAHHCLSQSTRCRTPSISRPGSGVTGIRSNDHIQPWQCRQEMAWRDLGENFFPRFITEVRCSNSSCLGGQAFCRPVNINIKILKASDDSNCADPLLPTTLRSKWAFHDISMPVYCECSSA
ncbi:hypothetical protein CHS0354_014824 [Potamilus streckersoni]|uniref:Protein trunk n=1 Tax=Potamilus streckersoni TaxID=2493646 RepID=A0AAE0VJW3_9BIVA|nr:hypothetical protein CHS0354_014824 [Potamilus streckersoni]